jgi:hypothetical protein
MFAWSRGRYAPRAFLAAAGIVLLVSIARLLNTWPGLLANLSTAAPLLVQLVGALAIAAIGLTILSALVGLAMGTLPPRLAALGRPPDRDAILLALSAGLFGAAAGGIAAAIRTAEWARFPPVGALGTVLPIADVALDPLAGLMTRIAVVTAALLAIDRWTASWTRRRVAAGLALAVVGFLAGGAPTSPQLGGWALAGLVTSVAMVVAYATLLRFDLTMVPVALGVMTAIAALGRAAGRPFPGAVAGAILAVVFVTALAAAWFRALRRPRSPASPPAV